MKWKLLLFLTIPLIILGCSKRSNMKENKNYYSDIKETEIKNNKTTWENKISSIPKVTINKSDLLPFDSLSLKDMGTKNKVLLQGRIINFKAQNEFLMLPKTEMIIHVDKIIAGNSYLKNSTISTFTNGGYTTEKHFYRPVDYDNTGNDFSNSNKKIFVNDFSCPIPKIGNKIIIYINLKSKEITKDKIDNYTLVDPTTCYWVFDKHKNKYIINNKNIDNNFDDKSSIDGKENLIRLTKEINKVNNSIKN